MENVLRQSDFDKLIKEDEIQLSVLKDYVKDKNKKIAMLKVINIILTLLLILSITFVVTTQKMNIHSQNAETVISELKSIQEKELKADITHRTERSENVYRNKEDK